MIQVIKDVDNKYDYIERLSLILVVLNIIAITASVALGYYMSRKVLAPIDHIVQQAKAISVNNLNKRINIQGPDDELRRLSETFNDLISRVEKGYDKQNRFALDASHELATPLAVINGYVDIVSKWGKNEPKVLDEALHSMKKEISNMTSLLDKLLFVAKSDNDISRIEKEEFWIQELISEVSHECQLIFKEYKFIVNNNESIKIHADKRLMKQMLRAIINNSIRYSSEKSDIVIKSQQVDDSWKISFKDQGIGISEEDLPFIFDRFYRVDKARSRENGGSGLGLSIVKWIVDVHNGQIHVESVPHHGTTFIVTIPLENR